MLHVLMDNGHPASLAVLKTNRYGESMHTIIYQCGFQWLYCKQHKFSARNFHGFYKFSSFFY